MPQKKGEFIHRISIFEGAYRAWSHLGGCDVKVIRSGSLTAAELDPLLHPHDPKEDKRVPKRKGDECPQDSLAPCKPIYPHEPLPRNGLAHPFVQAIIAKWLGPDADELGIEKGLKTLKNWWKHRNRFGLSASITVALCTPKTRTFVDAYTMHFFNIAYHVVVHDHQQPPGTLCDALDIGGRNNNDTVRSISGISKINVDICVALQINGIKCAHCVTIIEAALTGSFGSLSSMPRPPENSTSSSSPIPGLLYITVHQESSVAIIKISNLANPKQIVIEVSNLLRLIGYDVDDVHNISL